MEMASSITAEQLVAILADHAKWLSGEGGNRANLSSADLSGADLSGASLRSADLSSANLSSANLSSASLRSASLRSANLRSANLSSADLSGADLSGASLRSANLRSADLSSADLRGADLSSADLRGANGAEVAKAITEIVPREGEFVGWKKCRMGALVKLKIPFDASRSNATGRKCRASKAVVLEIVMPGFNGSPNTPIAEAKSLHDETFIYRVGETVVAHEWGADRFVECAGGIHFYLTHEEAAAH
jgi:hypothetical protein